MQTSMKFEYCASCVEQPQLIYTVTSKPQTTFKQSITNFVAPWYVHIDERKPQHKLQGALMEKSST